MVTGYPRRELNAHQVVRSHPVSPLAYGDKTVTDPFGYDPKSEDLEAPMLSVYTTDLFPGACDTIYTHSAMNFFYFVTRISLIETLSRILSASKLLMT